MNRRDFIKTCFGGALAGILAPAMIGEAKPDVAKAFIPAETMTADIIPITCFSGSSGLYPQLFNLNGPYTMSASCYYNPVQSK